MTGVQTAALVKALMDPAVYPHRPTKVELVQTQMSLVFLTGEFVYKVKKPVNLGYVDYTTLEQRRLLCEQEVKLNRRLCPQVYLGVVPITVVGGRLVVEGEGEVAEYAVKMLQLPHDRMLDVLLAKKAVTEEMVRQVAARMAVFHGEAETSPAISAFGSVEAIRINTEENFSQTEKYVGSVVSAQQYNALQTWTGEFITARVGLFRNRVAGGRIRDCHGDLHAAHVCFSLVPLAGGNGICIYDCIEFNDRFRYCDVASEIAFLAMDLDFNRRPDLSKAFADAYIGLSGDAEVADLLVFYKVYRAYVRGKVECFKSEDKLVSDVERARSVRRARAYFRLATSYIKGPAGESQPLRLFITVGLTGTGKTVLAQALAKRMDMAIISSDVVRKKLATIPLAEHHYEEFDRGLYSAEFTRRTYDVLFEEAEKLLVKGKSVVLDASFRRTRERRRAEKLARACGATFWTIEVTCPEDMVRRRLERRMYEANVPSDGRWEIYLSQKQDFDPVEAGPRSLRVDSSQPVGRLVKEIVRNVTAARTESTPRRRR